MDWSQFPLPVLQTVEPEDHDVVSASRDFDSENLARDRRLDEIELHLAGDLEKGRVLRATLKAWRQTAAVGKSRNQMEDKSWADQLMKTPPPPPNSWLADKGKGKGEAKGKSGKHKGSTKATR